MATPKKNKTPRKNRGGKANASTSSNGNQHNELEEEHVPESSSGDPDEQSGSLSLVDLDEDFFGSPPSNPTLKRKTRGFKVPAKTLPGLEGQRKESAGSLFESVKRGGALQTVAEDWLTGFDEHGLESMVDLLNFVLWSCGGKQDYVPRNPPADVNNMGADEWSSFIEAMVNDLIDQDKVEYPLVNTSKFRRFRESYVEFWGRLVEACRRGADLRQEVLAAAVNMLTTASSAPFQGLRHTATVAGLEIGTSCLNAAKSLASKLEVATRQLDAEAKKASGSKKAKGLKQLQRQLETGITQLEEVTDAVFKGIFSHRYRDVHPDIRRCCVDTLGSWILTCPSIYLEDQYLKYLGWLLNDQKASVRVATIQALTTLYQDEAKIASLEAFTVRFVTRMAEMAADTDQEVQLHAFKLLKSLLKCGFLDDVPDEELLRIDEGVFAEDVSSDVRAESLSFVFEHLAEFDPSSKSTEKQRKLCAQLEAIVEFIHLHLGETGDLSLIDLVVDACLKLPQAEVLLCWSSFFTLLLRDKGLTDHRLSILIHVLTKTIEKVDPVNAELSSSGKKNNQSKKKAEPEGQKEELTVQLMKHLPDLLVRFSADVDKVEHLMKLAAYLDPQVVSVARYGKGFSELLKQLKKTFLQSTSEKVLRVCADNINLLRNTEGHGKEHELSVIIQQLFETTSNKILEEGINEPSQNQEFNLCLAMRQLRHLSFLIDPREFLDIKKICETIHEVISQRSMNVMVYHDHQSAASIFCEGLNLLFMAAMWQYHDLLSALEEAETTHRGKEYPEDIHLKIEELVEDTKAFLDVITEDLRLTLGMDLTNDGEDAELTKDQSEMVLIAQRRANVIVGELRHVFKLGYSKYRYLDRLFFRPDPPFMGLMQRFFESEERRSQEPIETSQDSDNPDNEGALVSFALMPLMKAVLYNFDNLNKRQAAAVVGHFMNSGKAATESVKHFTQQLKTLSPVRYLEVQFATLRLNYERWLLLAEEEGDVELIDKGYKRFIPLAQRLCQSLGVGPLKGQEIKESFYKFMQEGVRYSLEEAPAKLSFLEGIAFFFNKLTNNQKKELKEYWEQAVEGLSEEVQQFAQEVEIELQSEATETTNVTRAWRAFVAFQNLVEGKGTTAAIKKGQKELKLIPKKRPRSAGKAAVEEGLQDEDEMIELGEEGEEKGSEREEPSQDSQNSSPWISPLSSRSSRSSKSSHARASRSRQSVSALVPIEEWQGEELEATPSSTGRKKRHNEDIPSDDDAIYGALQSENSKKKQPKLGKKAKEPPLIGSLVEESEIEKEEEEYFDMTPIPTPVVAKTRRSVSFAKELVASPKHKEFLASQDSVQLSQGSSEGLMTEDELFLTQPAQKHNSGVTQLAKKRSSEVLEEKCKKNEAHEVVEPGHVEAIKSKFTGKSRVEPEPVFQERMRTQKRTRLDDKRTFESVPSTSTAVSKLVPQNEGESESDLFDDFMSDPFSS